MDDKIKVTALQRANAIEARDVLWPSIRPEQVVPRLRVWFCGTHACFGGWCALHPPFKAQGLVADTEDQSIAVDIKLTGESYVYPDLLLLGDNSMFDPRGCCEADEDFVGTDHELVTHRLNWLISNSEVVENGQD